MQVPKKVLCVCDCSRSTSEEPIPNVEVGCTYHPDYMVEQNGRKFYVLNEIGYPYAYWIKAFVELDEDESEALLSLKNESVNV